MLSSTTTRRYDVDSVRVYALGLLILYHAVVGFQPWAREINFVTNEQSLEALWIPMGLINVWRIPIVFMVSGMGVCFAMERRTWKPLLGDRALRILVPFVFGFFAIAPIFVFISQSYYGEEIRYRPNPGHLWFLGNIFLYGWSLGRAVTAPMQRQIPLIIATTTISSPRHPRRAKP